MNNEPNWNRRGFFDAAGKIGAGLMVGGIALAQHEAVKNARKKEEKPEEIGPTEDLMREHGVLNRVLLIYDHFVYQIDQKRDIKSELVTNAANIIRSFVEDYHERQEEQFLFPRFEKARVLTDLVPVLKAQHQAGRKLTDQVVGLAKARSSDERVKLAQVLGQ